MAIRNVVKEGDDVLRKKARPVIEFNKRLHDLLDDMAETMYATNGVGLAANQVGILRRVVVIDIGEGLIELVNPEIVKKSGNQQEVEGCLSSPGEYGITDRPMKVKVEAFDRFGNEVTYEGEGLLARAFCHELDHLDGILFKDNAIRMLAPDEIQN
ncbi:MAG: peptide deformylase [Ruminococcus sp.]|nr:peptide deformylase [Oscillospiraceae bacterium]MBR2724216.1 peptide deformylase [Ruminococcus sp.]